MSKRLKRIQRGFRDTAIEQLNSDGTWSQWMPSPLSPANSRDNLVHVFDVDRFLSIYNRPLRRRQISHVTGAERPPEDLVRIPQDGRLYVFGSTRSDTDGGLAIEALTTLHEVSEACLVKRKQQSVLATADNPGWLEDVEVGTFYFDTELRTVTEETELASEFVGKYFTFTNCKVLQKNDVVVFPNGEECMVEMPYMDSGFHSARIALMRDTRSNIVVTVKSADVATSSTGFNPYNRGTTSTTKPATTYNVTAWVGVSATQPDAGPVAVGEMRVYIDKENIGFEPDATCQVTVDGVTYNVKEVKYDHTFEQYRIDSVRV